jgi:hypothetical protein
MVSISLTGIEESETVTSTYMLLSVWIKRYSFGTCLLRLKGVYKISRREKFYLCYLRQVRVILNIINLPYSMSPHVCSVHKCINGAQRQCARIWILPSLIPGSGKSDVCIDEVHINFLCTHGAPAHW